VPRQTACKCTADTPVSLLCPACIDKRRRIRDRINRRKARAAARGQPPRPAGTAVLPPATVIDLSDALDYLAELLDDVTTSGQQLTSLEQQLVYSLAQVHKVLKPLLDQAAEELVEIRRDVSQYDRDAPKPKFASQ